MLKRLMLPVVLAVALLAVLLGAPACSDDDGGDTGDSASGLIKSVTMTKTVKEKTFAPGASTTVFGVNDTVHAVIAIKKAPKGTSFAARWTVVDVGTAAEAGQEIGTFEVTADGTRNVDFELKPSASWPIGKYQVEISVDGEVEQTVAWSVR